MAYTTKDKAGNKSKVLKTIKESKHVTNNRHQSLVHLADSVHHNTKHAIGHVKEIIHNYRDMKKHMKNMPEFAKHLKQMNLS